MPTVNETSKQRQAPSSKGVFWEPDALRQLCTALLLEPFRRAFSYEETEQRKDRTGELKPFSRIRDYEPLFRLVTLTSYGLGLTCALFRDVYHVLEYVPMGKGHFWVALKEMGRVNLMYRLGHSREALRLYVNPDVKSWIVPARINDAAWKRKLEEVAVIHRTHQLELLDPVMPPKDQTILELLAEVNLMNVVPTGDHATSKGTEQVPSGDQTRFPVGTKPGPQWEPPAGSHIALKDVQDSKLKALRVNHAETEFMERLESFLGADAYENDGGKWRVRYRSADRGKCLRVIAAMEEDVKSGKVIRCRPAHMEWTWKDFAP